jgi:hypothetical protein
MVLGGMLSCVMVPLNGSATEQPDDLHYRQDHLVRPNWASYDLHSALYNKPYCIPGRVN